jgi:RNA polymerase sigma-70 factor (ECF subfamily)
VSKPDHELIADCLKGQTSAFGDLVTRYQNRLYNTLVAVLGSADDAHDVAQEAFVSAFQKLHTFKGRSAFYSWLFRIALNASVSQKRKLRRVPVSIDAIREQSGTEPIERHPAARPEHSLETVERQVAVRAALAELAEEFRTALVLKEMEDLSYEEIAQIVGCPIGTVRSRIHRARAELRDKLQGLLREPCDS